MSVVASFQKATGVVKIDPSRRQRRAAVGAGNPAGDRGDQPCRARFADAGGWLHAAAGGAL